MTKQEEMNKRFDELWDLNFPQEKWLGKGKIELKQDAMKIILKSFLQSEIDLAVAEAREEIITAIKSMEHCGGCAEKDCTMSAQEAYEEILSLITNPRPEGL